MMDNEPFTINKNVLVKYDNPEWEEWPSTWSNLYSCAQQKGKTALEIGNVYTRKSDGKQFLVLLIMYRPLKGKRLDCKVFVLNNYVTTEKQPDLIDNTPNV